MFPMRDRCRLHHHLVDVAPPPILGRLEASNDGMPRLVKVPGGVFAGRVVAAADVPAGEAKPKMDPPSPRLETFFASLRRARLDVANLVEVRAAFRHRSSPSRVPLPSRWRQPSPRPR
jgi:hypothetical protein